MSTYIVECVSCHQAWEVPTRLLSTRERKVLVPGHMMLNGDTGEPEAGIICGGTIFSGVGKGEREGWKRTWPPTHPGRSLPVVLDGKAIRVVQV